MKKGVKCLVSVLLAGCVVLPFAACGGSPSSPQDPPPVENVALDATYELQSATRGGEDCSSDLTLYTAVFRPNFTARVTLEYLGDLERRDSAYAFDGTTLTETYRGETFTYTSSADTLTTIYEEMTVTLKKKEEKKTDAETDFESVLFGPDMEDSKFYNYCPAIMTETVGGKEIMHVWYCTNLDDGIMVDYIGYRRGEKQENGKWKFSEQQIVLSPTPDTWDACHTCDPAVVRGSFRYRGATYGYLMAYLGCVTLDYSKNETGIAVSNAPEGPWVKVAELNPLVPWQDYGMNKNDDNWGTGMPTLINLDGAGDILLTYQSGTRGTGVQRWNFADLDALIASGDPRPAFTVTLSSSGVVNSAGVNCRIGIPDFAWDEATGRFYACGVTNEKNPPDNGSLTRVNSHSLVAYLEGVGNAETLCNVLQSGVYQWKMVGYVGPSDTGFERNHNPGIVRTEYGRLPAADSAAGQIRVIVSTGHNSWPNENIFTYRLFGQTLSTPPPGDE